MAKKNLAKKVARLGLPLFELEECFDPHEALADVVKSMDVRLWESFPLLLSNAVKERAFDLSEVSARLAKSTDKSRFTTLVLLSLAFYQYVHVKFGWASRLSKSFGGTREKQVRSLLAQLRKDHEVRVSGRRLSGERMRTLFDNYFLTSDKEVKALGEKRGEFSLEYAMSQAFTPKQKELFLKKLKGEKMTKTEKEYFSRTVKKKLLALADPELHRLAQEMLS